MSIRKVRALMLFTLALLVVTLSMRLAGAVTAPAAPMTGVAVNWQTVMKWGLLLLLGALILPIALREAGRADPQGVWPDRMLTGAGILLTLAVVMWLLEKFGMRVAGAKCRDCKKRIAHGHAYCYDHLMARTNAAREKYHGERGTGI